ncbi:MAG: PA14 domain-containing protein, partial [Pirellulaceae bacterium]
MLSPSSSFLLKATAVLSILIGNASLSAQDLSRGEAIWKKTCTECHGADGQGVSGKYDHPLTGLGSLDEVAALIEQTMPEQDPSLCVGEDARAAAEFLLAKNSPPPNQATRARIELLHLTTTQYRNAIASIFDEFLGHSEPVAERGLRARYFNSRGFDNDKKVEERIDATIDVDWQQAGPLGDKTDPNEFCVQWEGSVFAPTSGVYRFIVQSPNGYRLYINRLNKPLLDSWVATINEPEKSVEIQLLGGRWYSLKFEFLKVKDPAVSVRLLWQPPHRARAIVPQSVLMPAISRPVMVVQTPFPADDSNLGYRRGTLVSNEWNQATTDAAIEVATIVSEHLPRFVGKKAEDEKFADAARKFCTRIAERSFRRSLSEELQGRYIDDFFQQTDRPADAAKGSLTAILKSPMFLYLGLNRERQDVEATAERVAWALTDTLPTKNLEAFVSSARAQNTDARHAIAEEILRSPAGKLKWQQFFSEWLKLEETGELSKDQETFAGFDEQLVNDLQESLLRFV